MPRFGWGFSRFGSTDPMKVGAAAKEVILAPPIIVSMRPSSYVNIMEFSKAYNAKTPFSSHEFVATGCIGN